MSDGEEFFSQMNINKSGSAPDIRQTDAAVALPNRNWLSKNVGIICALTIALLLWALFIHSFGDDTPLSIAPLKELTLAPYFIGLYAREIAVPLILLFLLSRFTLFRRVTTDIKPAGKDLALLTIVLIAIQIAVTLLTISQLAADQDSVALGILLPFAAGLLGGWRVGLLSGIVAMIGLGSQDYYMWGYEGAIDVGQFIDGYQLKNIYALVALWVGPAAGLAADHLRKQRRLMPMTVLGIAILFQMIILLSIYLAQGDPTYFVERMIPYLVVFAVAALAVAMMMQSVQNDAAHSQIETTKLTLAETQLDLTQTKLALTQAELRALHAQINPHFFFNSLNTIRYFIRTDPDTARDLLTKLSDIFQRVLSAGESISLREEIEQIEAYLGLEKARLEDRLQVIWTNLAPDLVEQSIPPLILQPIVENAVIHGLSPKPEGGTIHIVINHVNDELLIQVDDDGMGFDSNSPLGDSSNQNPSNQNERPSLGLQNVDERLRMLYGDDHKLIIQSQPGEGTRVIMKIPLTEDEPASADNHE